MDAGMTPRRRGYHQKKQSLLAEMAAGGSITNAGSVRTSGGFSGTDTTASVTSSVRDFLW